MTRAAKSLDRLAVALTLMLCVSWGFNQVIVKVALPEIGPMTQAGLRCGIGFVLVALYAAWARPQIFRADGTGLSGLIAGLLFTFEFIMLFIALGLTTAARAGVFVYTAPFFVALGAAFFLPGERPRPLQWAGLAIAFIGVALGVYRPSADANVWGDALALVAAAAWGATTIVIKASPLRRADPFKILLYQIGVGALVSPIAAFVAGEHWPQHLSPLIAANLAYQGVWVVAFTFLVWFWLLGAYNAAELSAFTFLTPIVGVFAGWLTLGEQLTASFLAALILVVAGLVLINWPRDRWPFRAVRRDPG
jgi:drug/metabolite transporter (DMT)-like permease